MKKTQAFTLIELLAVMAIMALMMTIAVASFYDWGKHSAMRGSLFGAKSCVAHARQFAVTHRMKTTWFWTNITEGADLVGAYLVTTNWPLDAPLEHLISQTNYLATGIIFSNSSANNITFGIDGSIHEGGATAKWIALEQNWTNGICRFIKVSPLTGRTRIVPE